MPLFYRVHPYLESAARGEKGNAFYVPASRGGGRIDNDEYSTLYVADTPAGAVAEVFGDHSMWTPDLFLGPSTLAGSRMALSTLEGAPAVVDLNDPSELVRFGLRPSRIVTRHRTLTRAWALSIFMSRGGEGVRWWSYHDPDWGSLGLWDFGSMNLVSSVPLESTTPAVVEAGAILRRPFVAA